MKRLPFLLTSLQKIFRPLGVFWRLFRISFFQILAGVVLPFATYIVFDQGAEILAMMGEDITSTLWEVNRNAWAPFFFVIMNGLAGLAIWWTARSTLAVPRMRRLASLLGRRFGPWFFDWWPRLLGLAPLVIIAAGSLRQISRYHPPSPETVWGLRYLAAMHIAVAALLLGFFIFRRPFMAWLRRTTGWPEWVFDYWPWTLLGIGACSLGVLVVWFGSVSFLQQIGLGAVFSFSAIVSVLSTSILSRFQMKTGIPVFFLLFLLLVVSSLLVDNHLLRKIVREEPPERAAVGAAFEKWAARMLASHPGKEVPCFIVATEGGGIRAAYWTAVVLAGLQEGSLAAGSGARTEGDFASHVFAISGVSGGSIGSAVFAALLADEVPEIDKRSKQILGDDHLAPLISGLCVGEIYQAFSPILLPRTDRATTFEQSMEGSYRKYVEGAMDHRGLGAGLFWREEGKYHVPHLFLNSTLVESGQRIIFSDLAIDRGFIDAKDACDIQSPPEATAWDVPLITAAHASSRFTYSNPPGTLRDGTQCVDAGYFEDSGAATASEIVGTISKIKRVRGDAFRNIKLCVIMISHSSSGSKTAGAAETSSKDLKTKDSATKALLGLRGAIRSIVAPPLTLLQTRSARGTMERLEILEMEDGEKVEVIDFTLTKKSVPFPLGWSLSKEAAKDIGVQMTKDDPKNTEKKERVIGLLSSAEPLAP